MNAPLLNLLLKLEKLYPSLITKTLKSLIKNFGNEIHEISSWELRPQKVPFLSNWHRCLLSFLTVSTLPNRTHWSRNQEERDTDRTFENILLILNSHEESFHLIIYLWAAKKRFRNVFLFAFEMLFELTKLSSIHLMRFYCLIIVCPRNGRNRRTIIDCRLHDEWDRNV